MKTTMPINLNVLACEPPPDMLVTAAWLRERGACEPCRPCHSGFVAETIRRLHETTEVLYISLPHNVMRDTAGFDVEEVETPPCPEEKVYRVMRLG